MSITLAVLLVYLGTLAGLAIWARHETHTLKGFFLAGKKLPFWVVAFSTNATGESGWLLLGLTGMGYAVGAQAYWVVVGEMIGITLAWFLVARRLKRHGDETDSITVPDALAAKFEDRWHLIRGIAVLIILFMVTTYVTAQLVASGKALSGFLGMNYQTGVVVGAIIIIGYTFVGGYKAVAYTDVVQGVLMLSGLIVVPMAAWSAAGGWDGISSTLTDVDADYLDMFAISGIEPWVAALSFAAIGLPLMGVPQLLIRFMSIESEEQVGKAAGVSVFVLFVFLTGAVTAGIAGRALFPGLEDQETIFPLLANELFPPIIAGVLLVVVLSAIMSTVDSLLLLSSSAVVRDTMQQMLGSTKSDAQLSNYGKFVTVLIGIIGVGFAIPEAKFIFWFVLFAWSGLGAAFGPPVIMMLFDRRTTGAGVAAGMLCGFLASVIWMFVFKEQYYGLYEAIPGFLAGFLATIIVSRFTKNRAVV